MGSGGTAGVWGLGAQLVWGGHLVWGHSRSVGSGGIAGLGGHLVWGHSWSVGSGGQLVCRVWGDSWSVRTGDQLRVSSLWFSLSIFFNLLLLLDISALMIGVRQHCSEVKSGQL